MRNEIKKLFKAKEQFHKERANLPFERKIEMLIKLQKIAKEIKLSGRRHTGGVRF